MQAFLLNLAMFSPIIHWAKMQPIAAGEMSVRRYSLTDNQWEKISELLPGREDTVGVTTKDNRLFVETVLYRYRAGIPW